MDEETSAEIGAKYLGYLDSIQDLIKDIQAGNVQGVPEQKLAELNELYGQAQQQFQEGIGAYSPYVNTAASTMGTGVETLGQASDILGQSAQAYQTLGTAPTMEQIQPYMNPYQQAVRDEINRAYDIAANQASASAIGAGAFGGGREGVQRAELERSRASELAKAQAAAYGQGLQQFLGAQQASAAGLGAVGQGLGGLGTQFGGLGAGQAGLGFDVQKAGIADISTLLDFANLQQQQQQKGFDINYANQLAQYQQPFTELGFLGSAFGYAPSIPQYTTAGGGSVSPLQQVIGYGSLGLGALSGLKGLSGLF